MNFMDFKENSDDVKIAGSDKCGVFLMFGTFKEGKDSLVEKYTNDLRHTTIVSSWKKD